MKQLKEGKARTPTYRVVYFHNGKHMDEYIFALTAQQAVDICREIFAPEGAEIVEVAKVVNNWK